MKKCNQKRNFLVVTLGIATALTFVLDIRLPNYEDIDISSLNEFIHNFSRSLSRSIMESTLVIVAIVFVLYKIDKLSTMPKKIGIYVLSSLISVLWTMSKSFCMWDDNLEVLFCSNGQIIKTIIFLIGYFYLFLTICKAFYTFVQSKWCNMIKQDSINLKLKDGVKTFALILMCWIPHLIVAYPATVVIDAWVQLGQFYGKREFTGHHPVFHTWLIGIVMELGVKLKNGNVVFFLFIVLQGIIFSAIISYGIMTMKKLGSPKWLIYLNIVMAIVSPCYTLYIGMVTKDTFYSYFFVLFFIEIVFINIMGMEYWKSNLHCILFVFSAVMVILFRNNGKYIIYPILIILLLFHIKKYNKEYLLINKLKILVLLIMPIIVAFLINSSIISYYNISSGSIKEALSLPFQQTARYVVRHGDEVTEYEKKVINKVLDYSNLKQNYNSRLSDPVKNSFNNACTMYDLLNYFSVWIKQFIKHPLTYFMATINQNYYLIYPDEQLENIYMSTLNHVSVDIENMLYVDEWDKLESLEPELKSCYLILLRLPVVSLFSNIGFYNCILILILVCSVFSKNRKTWFLAMPILLSDLIVIAAPGVFVRYVLPIIYSMPILFAYYLKDNADINKYNCKKLV